MDDKGAWSKLLAYASVVRGIESEEREFKRGNMDDYIDAKRPMR
jgi:hypothetical protein